MRRASTVLCTAVLSTAVLSTAVLAGCSSVPGVFVVEHSGDAGAGTSAAPGSDPESYVEGIWASKLLPTVAAKAVDAPTVLSAIKADPAAAGTTYGRQSGTGSPYSFLVKGAGKVLALDQTGPNGTMAVDIAPGDGKQDLFVAVGPVFLGTALRDAVGFIDFSQFVNQIDFANVSTALNTKVREGVVGPLDLKGAVGQTVQFAGAFSLLDPTSIVVVPVELEVVA